MTTTITSLIPFLGAEATADSIIERYRSALETMGPVFQAAVPSQCATGESAPSTLYHLSLAQTCFLTAKAGTPVAERLTVFMAEVFALLVSGKLAAVDPATACELADAQVRAGCPTA